MPRSAPMTTARGVNSSSVALSGTKGRCERAGTPFILSSLFWAAGPRSLAADGAYYRTDGPATKVPARRRSRRRPIYNGARHRTDRPVHPSRKTHETPPPSRLRRGPGRARLPALARGRTGPTRSAALQRGLHGRERRPARRLRALRLRRLAENESRAARQGALGQLQRARAVQPARAQGHPRSRGGANAQARPGRAEGRRFFQIGDGYRGGGRRGPEAGRGRPRAG